MIYILRSSLPALAGVVCLWALGACTTDASPLQPSMARAQAGEHSDLPHAARPGVKAAMSRHAEHASALTVAVVLGAYDAIDMHTSELLAEPRPAAPGASDPSAFNQQLPASLFALEDDFRSALGKLRAAGRAHSEQQTLSQLTAVIRTCRACHRALRPERKGG